MVAALTWRISTNKARFCAIFCVHKNWNEPGGWLPFQWYLIILVTCPHCHDTTYMYRCLCIIIKSTCTCAYWFHKTNWIIEEGLDLPSHTDLLLSCHRELTLQTTKKHRFFRGVRRKFPFTSKSSCADCFGLLIVFSCGDTCKPITRCQWSYLHLHSRAKTLSYVAATAPERCCKLISFTLITKPVSKAKIISWSAHGTKARIKYIFSPRALQKTCC